MSSKTIYLRCLTDDGGAVDITQRYDDDCTWPAMAYQFFCFLKAQGYYLEDEDVGADVEAFCLATEKKDR